MVRLAVTIANVIDLGDLLLRGLFGSLGLGAVVALVRATYIVVTQRGPRRRVEAVKLAQETLKELPNELEERKFIEVQRDRELAALGIAMARAQKRAAFWESAGGKPFVALVVTTAVVLFASVAEAGVLASQPGDQNQTAVWFTVAGLAVSFAGSISVFMVLLARLAGVKPSEWLVDSGPAAVSAALEVLRKIK